MTVSVDMGVGPSGDPITIDLEELLATRLLVQRPPMAARTPWRAAATVP